MVNFCEIKVKNQENKITRHLLTYFLEKNKH